MIYLYIHKIHIRMFFVARNNHTEKNFLYDMEGKVYLPGVNFETSQIGYFPLNTLLTKQSISFHPDAHITETAFINSLEKQLIDRI